MASSIPSSSSPPASPPSESNSENSDNQPSPSKPPVDAGTNNGVLTMDDIKPDLSDEFDYLDSTENIEKFKTYEADYTHRLMAKYFSKKNLYGGNIFDEDTIIDGEVIKSSRWPCTRSFADPMQSFEDQNSSCSTAESPNSIANGKHPMKKNGV